MFRFGRALAAGGGEGSPFGEGPARRITGGGAIAEGLIDGPRLAYAAASWLRAVDRTRHSTSARPQSCSAPPRFPDDPPAWQGLWRAPFPRTAPALREESPSDSRLGIDLPGRKTIGNVDRASLRTGQPRVDVAAKFFHINRKSLGRRPRVCVVAGRRPQVFSVVRQTW